MKAQHSVGFFGHFRRASQRAKGVLAVVLSLGTGTTGLQAQGPVGGTVRAGEARISGEGTGSTRIDQASDRAILDWRSFGIGAGDQVIFVQPSAQAATLNRVTGAQVSVILGRLDANGQVLLINPNGVVFGAGAQVNVGSLIASTSNLSNDNFMAGRLVFDQPGTPGAGILNQGLLTARAGGLVALVAPHVRNDGVIVARLGKVLLGSADTFTVDLYGDTLINLALSDANVGQLRDAHGEPVTSLITNTGRIETAGGQTVLMTARNAKSVLDHLINMSGTIQADTAVEQNGRILLLADGGTVDVSGQLSARGAPGGTTGGTIQVLGDQVHLASTAALDASGAAGGGTVQVGGAFQGHGDTYRSTTTTIDAGATLQANATTQGNGGQVVVWSDGTTRFAGAVDARGGAAGGNGGQLEVSGKGTLDFLGQADASAAAGQAGTLLLDPAFMAIGAVEASSITRVLRTGTTANLQADVDIDVNAPIFGGDREKGGGLNLTAGHDVHVNDYIVTNDGAVHLTATQGTVTVAPDKGVFAGSQPITVTAGGTIHTGPLLTSGSLAIRSLAGSVAIDTFIDDHTGPVSITAAGTVDINQPIVNLATGSPLDITAGADINVNAQVDGRGGVEHGAVAMTAGHDLHVNQAIVTNNGKVALTATGGALDVTAATPLLSGSAALVLTAQGDLASGPLSAGTLTLTSTGGAVSVNGIIDASTGDTRIAAASDVNLNQAIVNGQTGSALAVTAGRDVNVNAVIDGRGGVAGGVVRLNATRNLNVNDYVLTNNGTLDLTASGGALAVAGGKGTFTGTAAQTLRAAGDLTTGAVVAGALAATSTGGAVQVNGIIDGSTGKVDLRAASDVAINAAVLNPRSGAGFTATAGRDVVVNAAIDGRGGATGGTVTLTASRDVALNTSVATNNGAIGVTATGGAATMATGTALVSGTAPIAITAGGNVTTGGISGGSLAAISTGGSVSVDGVIDGSTGRVDLAAAKDVTINAPVLNTRSGSSLNAAAGQNLTVNAPIDGTTGAAGGAVTLAATRDLTVNASILTRDGAINLSAATGLATVATTAGLFAGSGAVSLDALGNVATGIVVGGATTITSRGGSVTVTGPIAGTGGPMTLGAAGAVTVNQPITNPGPASPLSITAGTDITVNAAMGRIAPGTPSSAVTLNAGQNVTLNDSITTGNAAITVTADTGTVNTAATQGLFAGTGNITVQAGQTLSTGTTVTTGALTLRSTAGSVNVDTAIGGTTGPVTIEAATDVAVNQGIANPRADAPLAITAGRDINVNARIDGRDNALPGPSGAVTLTASNNVNLNEDIVTVDAAQSITATNGTVNWAAGKTLYSGAAPIAVTAGADLNTGTTSTTGALNLTSTRGDVNVNTAIDDTTGVVAIAAGRTVNVNAAITNLKSGANLAINAGTDINVAAPVDGRDGVLAGGGVVMTAGNDINLTQAIATADGTVTLTATNGSVTLPVGTEVIIPGPQDYLVTPMQAIIATGNAAVTLTSGDDFTLTSPVQTTGALTITSTHGNVTTAAPISDTTGAVTITAGDALVVNREIRTNDQPITLNAGGGGITINQIVDYDYTQTSSVNPRNANLTLNSIGDVTILDSDGVATTKTLTIDTRGRIVTGIVGNTGSGSGRPEAVVLNADGGIVFFMTGRTQSVTATSSANSINLEVTAPGRLRVTTGTPGTLDCPTCDITVSSSAPGGLLGPDVLLNAGGSVNLAYFSTSGHAELIARSGDLNLGFGQIGQGLTGSAGRDIHLSDRLSSTGALTFTAGRDFVATDTSPIGMTSGDPLTLTAFRNLTLFLLQTLGAVNLTATTGNITLNNDIGPHIINNTGGSDFNPDDLGVASLTISAPAASAVVTMQGARAQGDVVIDTGGTLTAAKQITSVFGTVSIFAAGGATLSAVPIGSQFQLPGFGVVSPVVAPGPRSPLPTAPGVASNNGPGLPVFAEIPVALSDQVVGGVSQPGAANGAVGLAVAGNGSGSPDRTTGVAGRPGAAIGSIINAATGTSDPATADTAAALRTAGESCGEETGADADNGLAAINPNTPTAADQQKASCPPPPATGGQAAAGAPTGAPVAPVTNPAQAATPAAPIGGGLQ